MATLTDDQVRELDLWFRAANYLSVGQIYLLDNPLLERPLERDDIKPRLLGHWGTTPGLNLVWTHLNRLIRERDVDAIILCGPGHGGPPADSGSGRPAPRPRRPSRRRGTSGASPRRPGPA